VDVVERRVLGAVVMVCGDAEGWNAVHSRELVLGALWDVEEDIGEEHDADESCDMKR
jgi:hypothetical protein